MKEEVIEGNKLSHSEKFDLANDPEFMFAIMDATYGAPPLQRDPFKTIADRIRLIEELEKNGFRIVKFK